MLRNCVVETLLLWWPTHLKLKGLDFWQEASSWQPPGAPGGGSSSKGEKPFSGKKLTGDSADWSGFGVGTTPRNAKGAVSQKMAVFNV